MSEELVFHFDVDGNDFTSAGQASIQIKKNLRRLGLDPETIRRVSIALYEGFSTAPDQIRSLGFGAGMGLPNMKRYTDEMKIESTVGVGTTVTMCVNI